MKVFNFKASDEYFKNQKKIVILLMIFIPVMIIITFLILVNFRIDFLLFIKILIPVIVFLEIIIYFSMKITLNKMRDNELIINETEVIRKNKNIEEKAGLISIIKLKTIADNKNKLLAIKIFYNNQSLLVSGYEKMDDILKLLSDKISNNKIEIINKKMVINFNNPVIFILYLFIICSLFAIFIKFNKNLYDNIQLFIPIIIGVAFLIFKPLSKNAGKRFLKFEIAISIILIALGLLNVFLKYFLL